MEAEKARNMERRKDFELQGRNPTWLLILMISL